MAEVVILENGDLKISFPENNESITISGALEYGVSPNLPNWHYYETTGVINNTSPVTNYVTLQDVRLALLQQSAPEWQDIFGLNSNDPSTPPAVSGSLTDTFGPSGVFHIVSNSAMIIVNATNPGHPFHPGYVIRTVTMDENGIISIQSVGIGNGFAGDFNDFVGSILFANLNVIQTQAKINALFRLGEECFPAGTQVLLGSCRTRSIEDIRVGDVVQSYAVNGDLVMGRVTRTFRNEVSHLLDFHGLKVTPGHVTLCGSGIFAGRHVPIIDILLSDGALVTAEGGLVRMSINRPVGSVEDRMVKVLYALTAEDARSGQLREGEMRVGTLLFDRGGVPVSVQDCLKAEGLVFDPETGLVAKPREAPHALHWFGPLPRSEDYILTRSRETLEGILVDGEWEGSRSKLIVGRLRQTAGVMN